MNAGRAMSRLALRMDMLQMLMRLAFIMYASACHRLPLSWALRSCLIGRRSRQKASVALCRGRAARTSVLVQMAEEQSMQVGQVQQGQHDGCP